MNPGSPDARQRGCRCSGSANQWGRGTPGSLPTCPIFEIHPHCAMHRAGWHRTDVEDGIAARKPHTRNSTLRSRAINPKGR